MNNRVHASLVTMVALVMSLPAISFSHTAQGQDTDEAQTILRSAAQETQKKCFMRIHFDTFQYQDCVSELSASHHDDDLVNLGINYFGYVGAMDAVRTGMLGAEQSAHLFLGQFRKLQKKLHISDQSLCASIPGNCDIRIALMKKMEQAPKPALIDQDASSNHHRH